MRRSDDHGSRHDVPDPSHPDPHITSTRSSCPFVTDKFEAVWPDLAERLRSALRDYRLDGVTVDDIVQEVGVKALVARPAFRDGDDLWPWVSTAARNAANDSHRRLRFRSPVAVPEQSVGDVADEAIGRMQLAVVEQLPHADIALLLGESDGPMTGAQRKRAWSLRNRLRGELERAVGGLAVVVAKARDLRPEVAAAVAVVSVNAVAAVVPVFEFSRPQEVAVAIVNAAAVSAPRAADSSNPRIAPASPRPTKAATAKPVRGASAPPVDTPPAHVVTVRTPAGSTVGGAGSAIDDGPRWRIVCTEVGGLVEPMCVEWPQ